MNKVAKDFKPAFLTISGIDVTVNIRQGIIEYKDSTVSSISSESDVYLPYGQKLSIKVTGIDVTLNIEAHLKPFVVVENSGQQVRVN